MSDSRSEGVAPGLSRPEQPAPGLRHALGLPAATATSAGLAFAAIDFLGIVSVATYAAGTSAWIAIAIAGALMFLVSGIFSELNGLYPTAAGVRLYLGRAFGNRLALSVTFAYMLTVVLVIAADAFIIGAAIRHVLHEPALMAYVWIAVLLGIATTANLFGVKLAGSVQTVVTYTVLASATALSLVAIFHVGGAFDKPFSLFGRGAFNGVQAIAFGVFLFAAFEWVTTTAEEARTPPVITRALFLAPVLLFICTALFALALTHAVPFASSHGSAYPQLLLGRAALGSVGELWMLAATLLTAINTFNGGFLVASRFLYAAAREGTIPPVFAKLNLRAVPWVAVTGLSVASALVSALVFATHQWLVLVSVGAAIEAGIYALVSACLVRLRRKEPRERPFRLIAAPVLGVAGVVIFGALGFVTAFSDPKNAHRLSVVPAAVLVGILIVTAGYALVVLPRMQARAAERARALAAARTKRRPQRPSAAPDQLSGERAPTIADRPVATGDV